MRRFRKIIILVGAALMALVLSVRHRGDDLQLEANAPLRAAVRQSAAYDLSNVQIITKTLFYVRENYFDKSRFDHKRMLVGALDFLQRDVPEILIDRYPERDPKQVKVRVGGQEHTFNIERVDSPWTMRSMLQEIFRFVQPNLQPVATKDEARRLVEVEIAAANGMLYTLDPHSVLLDVESFKEMRTQTQGKFGGLGIVIGMDTKGRIVVKQADAGDAGQQGGHQGQGPHRPHQQRVDGQHDPDRGGRAAARRRGLAGRRVHRADRHRRGQEVHHHARFDPAAGHRSATARAVDRSRRPGSRRPRSATFASSTSAPTPSAT